MFSLGFVPRIVLTLGTKYMAERVGPDGKKGSAKGTAKWEVIGTAYVHGFMDGLAMEWAERGMLKECTFDVV